MLRSVPLDSDDIRAYVQRPWAEIEKAKRAAQAAHANTLTPVQRARLADSMLKHVQTS